MTIFTPHQDSALKAVAEWLKAKPGKNGTPPIFRLFGYAGTGKTTLARHIADGLEGKTDRHRRMLDGRCRARPRPDVVRLSAARARRSRAAAADSRRRLLHR